MLSHPGQNECFIAVELLSGRKEGQALGIVTFSFPVVLMNQARSG